MLNLNLLCSIYKVKGKKSWLQIMTEKPGVKIEEFKTIKRGGTTRRETKIGAWLRSEESGRDGVGSGSHED